MSARTALPSGQVTFMFTDVEGSTRIAQLLRDAYRRLLREHREILSRAVRAHGGVPIFREGDALFAAFGDAAAAVAACVAAQRGLDSHDWSGVGYRPRVRMGLHTGPARPADGEYATPEVHRAARVAAAAHGGQVLCSSATAAAVTALPDGTGLLDLGRYRLRGFDGEERLHQVLADGLEARFPRPRTARASAHNLPAYLTNLVGRTAERQAVREALARHRLVTVAGPAGVGKTRLAVAVATDVLDRYPDGVWLADLADCDDADAVAAAVAASLGVRAEPGRPLRATLADHLAGRSPLLVLDTCDAAPEAVGAVLRRLLGTAPDLRVLATSRQPVGLAGELVRRLGPLSLRPAGAAPAEAVELLVDRAASVRGGAALDAGDRDALARVAERLDGLPLALELAARALAVLTPRQLAERLARPHAPADLGSAGPPDRHASVRASLDFSYRRLAPTSASLLGAMSVFAGPVGMDAIAAETGGDPLEPLSALVERGLVEPERAPDGMTYRLLGPVRAYAATRLAAGGGEDRARRRHVAWLLQRLRAATTGPDGQPATLSMDAFDPLADEVRAALEWSVTRGGGRSALAVMAHLDQWWRERGAAREARVWLDLAHRRVAATAEAVPDPELAVAHQVHALHAAADGEYAEERRHCDLAEQAARRTGDPGLLVRVLCARTGTLLDMADAAAAERVCRDLVDRSREWGVAADGLFAVCCLARLLWRRGALAEAADLLAAARPLEAARPAHRGLRTIDMLLGMVALARGDLVAAYDHLAVALRSRVRYGFRAHACESLHAFAVCCALAGEPDLAARLFGAAQANRSRLRVTPLLVESYWAEREKALRDRLGDARFDAAYAEGAGLELAAAVPLALAVRHVDRAAGPSRVRATADRFA